MPESARMILVLTLVSGAAGLGLAAMNSATGPLIAENERLFTLRSIAAVLPAAADPNPCGDYEAAYDNSPDADAVCVDGSRIYRGREGGEVVGLAVESVGDEAYSGTILTLVGLDLDGTVTGIEVLRHRETPGLGSLITDCGWRRQLVGKGPDDQVWKVTKDGGDIDHIAGATISSRSMIDAILKAQRLLAEKKGEILAAEPLEPLEVCHAP